MLATAQAAVTVKKGGIYTRRIFEDQFVYCRFIFENKIVARRIG